MHQVFCVFKNILRCIWSTCCFKRSMLTKTNQTKNPTPKIKQPGKLSVCIEQEIMMTYGKQTHLKLGEAERFSEYSRY